MNKNAIVYDIKYVPIAEFSKYVCTMIMLSPALEYDFPIPVNGRDKLIPKWSFKSEPLWNGRGIISMLSDLIPDKEENGLKKKRPYWTYSY